MPETHFAAFYDMLSQMLRNAIEHGIEIPAQRRAGGKNPRGTLLVEFQLATAGIRSLISRMTARGWMRSESCRWPSPADDRRGHIAGAEPPPGFGPDFQSGLSTAAEPGGRGWNMRILRDNVKRLHGQIQVATKRGLFTRLRIRVPLAASEAMLSATAALG